MSTGSDIYITTDRDLATAISGKADLVSGKLEVTQLPAVADDVIDYAGCGSFPETGESGKIYVDTSENKLYRYNGSGYVSVGGGSVTFPVTSVNSKTGVVVLNGSDISVTSGAYSGSSVNTAIEGLASGKVDKIASSGSTVGHFVSIGENGTLLDSTKNDKDFAAYSHMHEICGVNGLESALNGKASVNHTHQLADINTTGIVEYSILKTDNKGGITSAFAGTDYVVPASLGNAAYMNAPVSGDASSGFLVLGGDSRLSDSRPPREHTHAQSDVSGLADALVSKASKSDVALAALSTEWSVDPWFLSTARAYASSVGRSDLETYSTIEFRALENPGPTTHGVWLVSENSSSGMEIGEGNIGSNGKEFLWWIGHFELARGSVVATRQASVPAYKLGEQLDKPLAPADDYALKSQLGTAASKNVPISGNASTSQVVTGSDTRLSDARTPTEHVHEYVTCGDTTLKPVSGGGAVVSRVAGYGPPSVSGSVTVFYGGNGSSYTLVSTGFQGPYGPFSQGQTYYVPVGCGTPTDDNEATSGWSIFFRNNGGGSAYLMHGTEALLPISGFDSENPSTGEWEHVDSSSGSITISRTPVLDTRQVVTLLSIGDVEAESGSGHGFEFGITSNDKISEVVEGGGGSASAIIEKSSGTWIFAGRSIDSQHLVAVGSAGEPVTCPISYNGSVWNFSGGCKYAEKADGLGTDASSWRCDESTSGSLNWYNASSGYTHNLCTLTEWQGGSSYVFEMPNAAAGMFISSGTLYRLEVASGAVTAVEVNPQAVN